MAPRQPAPRTLSPEVPVVSYPTPDTNDLLVVLDVDTRLPGYTPANYGDGHPDSVTYPDLKLVYQTPLDNEANFMWVRRVYANSRFNQEAYNYAIKYSGEDPGKPIYVRTYTLPRDGYSPLPKRTPDPVYPNAVLVEEAVDRLKDDQTDGQLDSLFLKVTRVYETLPGPGLVTKKKGSANSIPAKFQAARQVTVTKSTVAANIEPTDTSSTIVESSVEQATVAKAQKIDSVLDSTIVTLVGNKVTPQQQLATVSEKMVPTGGGLDSLSVDALTIEGVVENLGNGQSVVTQIQAPSLFTEQTYATEKPLWGIPMKFKVANPPLKDSHVVAGTVSANDVTLAAADMDKTAEQVTAYKKKITASSMSPRDVSLVGTQTGVWGVESISESLLNNPPSTLAASGAYKTKEDSVDPIGDGRAVRKTVTFPTSPGTLTEYRSDETTGIVVKLEKTLVSANPTLPVLSTNQRVDVQPIDVWNSIQIVSSVDTTKLPSNESWTSTTKYAFPDELSEIGILWGTEKDQGGGTTGVNSTPSDSDSWVLRAESKASAGYSASVYTKIIRGYSGPIKITTVRSYLGSAPTDGITPTLIKPVYGTVSITGVNRINSSSITLSGKGSTYQTRSDGFDTQSTGWSHSIPIGPFLHNNITSFTTGSTPPAIDTNGGTVSNTASSGTAPGVSTYPTVTATAVAKATASLYLPTSVVGTGYTFTTGTTFVLDVHVEKWRFGIWVKEVTTATVP